MAYEFTQQLRQKGMVRDGDTATGQELKDGEAPPAGTEVYYTDAQHRLTEGPVPGGKAFWRRMQHATFTHWPDSLDQIMDDMLKNERQSGQFK